MQVGHKIGHNEKRADSRSALNGWCERGDSNPHGFIRQILSLVRLPIPPLSQRPDYTKPLGSFEVIHYRSDRMYLNELAQEATACRPAGDGNAQGTIESHSK
jgi:hypothetical protein